MRTIPRLALHALVGVTATAMAATLALVAPAQAAEPVGPALSGQNVVVDSGYADAVEALEPYVHRSPVDGTFVLDAPQSTIEAVGPEAHATIQEHMAIINEMIAAGLLVSTDDLRAVLPDRSDGGQDAGDDHGILHHGRNDLECGWVNCTLYLDAENTQNLLGLLQIGAGASTIGGAICTFLSLGACALPAGLVVGIITMGSGVIQVCANSHGVWIRIGLGSWCGGQ